jgi:anthranilate/para-aminobenzoate synthase component II
VVIDDYSYRQLRQLYIQPCPVYWEFGGGSVRLYEMTRKMSPKILKDSPEYIVLSPGPSDPDHAGVCLDLIGAATDHGIPLLGVCLGHQSIGQYFGGKVIRAPQPMHGKISSFLIAVQGFFPESPLHSQ